MFCLPTSVRVRACAFRLMFRLMFNIEGKRTGNCQWNSIILTCLKFKICHKITEFLFHFWSISGNTGPPLWWIYDKDMQEGSGPPKFLKKTRGCIYAKRNQDCNVQLHPVTFVFLWHPNTHNTHIQLHMRLTWPIYLSHELFLICRLSINSTK